MSAFARKPLTSLVLVLIAVALLGVSASAAEARAKRIGIDKSFGAGGYASVPLNSRANFWGSETICAAGSRGVLVGITYKSDLGALKGAALAKYGGGGRRLWKMSLKSREAPLAIHSASGGRWIVSLKRGHDYSLVRLLASGRRDKSFGEGGRVALPADDTTIWLRDGGFVQVDTATVYTRDGKPDERMNGDGRIVTGFRPTDVVETSGNRLFVLGETGGYFQLAKLTRKGANDPGWNAGNPVALADPPESVWKKSVLKEGGSSYTEAIADKFYASLATATASYVDLNYNAPVTLKGPKSTEEIELAVKHRLTGSGAVDTTLKGTGWQFISAERGDEELEADDDEYWVERETLSDGRSVKASFTVGSEIDPGSWSTFSVSDRAGRFDASSARIFSINRLRFGGYDFDRKGSTMYFCGMYNFSRWVVGRVRL